MSKLTKAQQADKESAIGRLQECFPIGTTVHTSLAHVSASGMQREIKVYVATIDDVDGSPGIHEVTYSVSRALGLRVGKRGGVIVGGCGMDMGFQLCHNISYELHGFCKDLERACGICGAAIGEPCTETEFRNANGVRSYLAKHRMDFNGTKVHQCRRSGYTLIHNCL